MSRKETIEFLIAHPQQQHSFRLAIALQRAGYKVKYVTTVYDKPNSIMGFMKRFLNKNDKMRFDNRRNDEVDDRDIILFCEFWGLFQIIIFRFIKNKTIHNYIHRYLCNLFGKKVAKYAMQNKVENLIMYDDVCYKAFSILEKKSSLINKIMDVSAANRLYKKEIYQNDLTKSGEFTRLYTDAELLKNKKVQQMYYDEVSLTNKFIVPSEFVKKSLLYSSINESEIIKVPYGVDINKFSYSFKKNDKAELRFIYVGGIKVFKGIYYLLEAFKELKEYNVKLTVIGTISQTKDFEKEYSDVCEFIPHIPRDIMKEKYNTSDIMIMPSLAEGMSLSVLEAMSCGLPVIATRNSGTEEIIENFYNGFNIEIQSIDEIKERVIWFVENKKEIEKMSQNARKTAEEYTWEQYYKRLGQEIKKII